MKRIQWQTVILGMVVWTLSQAGASGALLSLTNPGFENTNGLTSSLTVDNQFDFVKPYIGWTEYDTGTGNPSTTTSANNVGPINVAPGDISSQAYEGVLALFGGNDTVRIDQTTSHVIEGIDISITLTVAVGNDGTAGFGGYFLGLYAENSGSSHANLSGRTLISSVTGTDVADNSWALKSVTLNAAQLAPYVGKSLGIEIGKLSTGRSPFFDAVTLDVVPEPTSALLLCVAAGLLIRRR